MLSERKRIYVADDEDNIRQVVKTFLTSDGYEVEDFPTGDLLLERFRQEPCDLAIEKAGPTSIGKPGIPPGQIPKPGSRSSAPSPASPKRRSPSGSVR